MRPQDIVAIILAVGVVAILLTGTSIRYLYLPPEAPGMSVETSAIWKDIINVIVGALAGYIAGRVTKGD